MDRSEKLVKGRTISHYRIVGRLGGGGMGVVYKAEDLRLGRFVALKFLPPEITRDEVAKRRFVREAQAASALDHPNICSIHEIDETPEGRLFIVMAFYDGETLDKRLEQGPLPVNEALHITAKVADGLARAHGQGIVHRDVKPGNIMLTRDNEVKILDFGLAKLRGTSQITGSGTTVGTCAYMSPEQARGDDVDARSDLFSLGASLYELLGGRAPFQADHANAVLYQVMNSTPRTVSDLRPEVTPRLQRLVDRALQKDVSARYQSAEEMRDDLLRLAGVALPFWARFPRAYRRLAAVTTIVAGVAVTIALTPPLKNTVRRWFARPPERVHVAVLPFENVGRDPLNQAFCDGLVETLSSQLSQLEPFREALWVVPITEVRAYKVKTPMDARRLLGVNLVITGAVQRLGDRFRVTLNLIDAAHGATSRQLNAAMIDDRMEKVAILQDETVVRMAGMMGMKLHPEEERVLAAGGTSVSPAYDSYLQGVGYVRSYDVEGNLDRAIATFSMAIERDSTFALAYAGLGEAYWRKYRDTTDPKWIDPAVRNARRAVALDSVLAPAHVTLAMTLSGTGQPERAIAEFRHALELEPSNVSAYNGLAAAYAAAGRTDEAEATYRKVIAMKPDYWGAYSDFGKFYFGRAQWANALAQFQKVIELRPDNQFGYNNAGACYWYLDQKDKAKDMFMRSLQVAPNPRAYANLSALYYEEGRYVDAAVMCEQALKLNDKNYMTWVNLANAYYFIPEKRDKAMAAYRRAIEIAEKQRQLTPHDAYLLSSLAGYYALLGDRQHTLSLIDEALKLAPTNSRVLFFVGEAYEQIGQRDRALYRIEQALRNGYAVSDLENDPFLRELRTDDRYAALISRAHRGK